MRYASYTLTSASWEQFTVKSLSPEQEILQTMLTATVSFVKLVWQYYESLKPRSFPYVSFFNKRVSSC